MCDRRRDGSFGWTDSASLSSHAVSFDRAPILALTPFGTPYTRWVKRGMPKLGQYTPLLKAVFFLYPDKDSAVAGVKAGGTGFFVGVPMKEFPGRSHVHAVTNYHVAVFNKDAPPNPVVRINRFSGPAEPFEFDPSEWIFRSNHSDVAISPPLGIVDGQHDFRHIDASWFITAKEERDEEVGPGDDTFMIGRFVDYDGIETNVPAARFGHISMMDARIRQTTGYNGRSIVLDMHSRSGFSGSPVFVYRTLGSHFMPAPKPGSILTGGGHYMKLLGIHFAQFPEAWELKAKPVAPLAEASLQADSHYIEGLSGMTCVVPAADILTVLNDPELNAMRDKTEKKAITGPFAAKPETGKAKDANPEHREDFKALLSEAARTRPRDD